MKENMAKKISVHCVQRQDLRTVTKEPITGLMERSVELWAGRGKGRLTLRLVRGRESRCRMLRRWLDSLCGLRLHWNRRR